MTRIFTLAVLLLTCVAVAFADDLGVTLNFFRAGFEGTDVKVEWELANENGVNSFEVHRKLHSETTFRKIGGFPATGTRRYTVLDTDLRNVPNRTGTITYKVSVATTTGESNFTTTFLNNPSSVERSWGSIKSMFR